jgi:hypothetical protein
VYNCGTSPYSSLYHMPFLFRLDRTRWSGAGFDWTALPPPGPGTAPLAEDYNLIETAVPNPAAADLDGDGRLEILYPSYDGKLHAYWLDKTEHGSWPHAVPATGAGNDTFRFASEPVVADLDGDGQAEVLFTSWPRKDVGGVGHLHVLSSLGVQMHRVALPAPDIGGTYNGGLGAPTLANIDADPDLEVVIGTVASGVVAYDLPGTANARVLWGTGRGGQRRTGSVEIPSLSIDDVTVAEGNGGTTNAVFTVRLTTASAQAVTVNYATVAGTAAAGNDYTASSGVVTFPPGSTAQPVTVPVVTDLLDEADETFTLALSSAAGALMADGQGVATITDDDPTPSLSIGDVAVAEGTDTIAVASLPVTLSAPSGRTVSAAWSTADGSAAAASDYAGATASVVFTPGVTVQSVNVGVVGDRVDEGDETFVVNLATPVNATIAGAQGEGTILDDDAPGLSIADVAVVEPPMGGRTATFTVTLSPTSGGTVTVSYSTANVTATAGSDYQAASDVLTFDPGVATQTIAVTVHADGAAEGIESFAVNLAGASGAAIASGQAVGRIHDPGNFFSLPPCRVLDTRNAAGPYGGPALGAGQSRTFTFAGRCAIPASATAVALNVTVTQPSALGHLALYPVGVATAVSSLNYRAGQARANNAVVALSAAGQLVVRSGQTSGTAHVIVDVTGYFE